MNNTAVIDTNVKVIT